MTGNFEPEQTRQGHSGSQARKVLMASLILALGIWFIVKLVFDNAHDPGDGVSQSPTHENSNR